MSSLTVLENTKIIFVQTPKVASSSMIDAMNKLGGFTENVGSVREWLRSKSNQQILRDRGIHRFHVTPENMIGFQAEKAGFLWVCISRDPASRLLSAYGDKVHRYAKVADKRAFWLASLGRIKEGPKGIASSRYLASYTRKHVSLDAMLRGMTKIGTEFDAHFSLQTGHTMIDKIRYDLVMRLEDIEADFAKLCDMADVPLPELRQLNAGASKQKKASTPTSAQLGMIATLYAEDFKNFDYPLPKAV